MGALDDLVAHTGGPEPEFGLQDTWPVRLAKGVYESAKDAVMLPGEVYRGDQSLDDPALIGRALNFATMASPGVAAKLPARPSPVAAPTAEALHAAGRAGYGLANMSNVAMDGNMLSRWATMMQGQLRKKGLFDTSNNAPNTFAILKDLEATGKNAQLTAGDYINLRQALQKHAQAFNNGHDSAAASIAIKQLDSLWDNAPSTAFVAGTPAEISGVRTAIKDARANFAAGYRSDLLTGKEYAAELRSAAANSGKNYDNSVRQRVAGIPLSKSQSSGYDPEEIAGIEDFIHGSGPRNLARDIGNKMGGGGGFLAGMYAAPGVAASAYSGDLTGALLGVGIPTAGAALKGLENALTRRDLRRLDNTIRLRSPAGQRAVENAPLPAPLAPPSAQFSYRALLNPLTPEALDEYFKRNPNES